MNMRAISPVIATVIIVSVAIAIAVAVAFWMTGITGLFTRYEKLEIVSAYATAGTDKWTVKIIVRNSGTTDATIDEIFINGRPLGDYDGTNGVTPNSDKVTLTLGDNYLEKGIALTAGSDYEITLYIPKGEPVGGTTFSSGQIVEVKLHTASGNEYPKSVQLP